MFCDVGQERPPSSHHEDLSVDHWNLCSFANQIGIGPRFRLDPPFVTRSGQRITAVRVALSEAVSCDRSGCRRRGSHQRHHANNRYDSTWPTRRESKRSVGPPQDDWQHQHWENRTRERGKQSRNDCVNRCSHWRGGVAGGGSFLGGCNRSHAAGRETSACDRSATYCPRIIKRGGGSLMIRRIGSVKHGVVSGINQNVGVEGSPTRGN